MREVWKIVHYKPLGGKLRFFCGSEEAGFSSPSLGAVDCRDCQRKVEEFVSDALDDAEEREALEQVARCAFSLLVAREEAYWTSNSMGMSDAFSRLSLALGALPDATKERLRGMK